MATEHQGLKDKQLQAYYEALATMYPTAGWGVLLEDLGRLREIYANIEHTETLEDLWFRKGQLNVVDQMLNHAARSEQGYAAALEEESGEEQKITGGKATVVGVE